MSMNLEILKKLAIEKDDDYFEIEEGDYATIWLADGDCWAVEILEIRDTTILIKDEDGNEQEVPMAAIVDIEQG